MQLTPDSLEEGSVPSEHVGIEDGSLFVLSNQGPGQADGERAAEEPCCVNLRAGQVFGRLEAVR